jgi:hypothetical protein
MIRLLHAELPCPRAFCALMIKPRFLSSAQRVRLLSLLTLKLQLPKQGSLKHALLPSSSEVAIPYACSCLLCSFCRTMPFILGNLKAQLSLPQGNSP